MQRLVIAAVLVLWIAPHGSSAQSRVDRNVVYGMYSGLALLLDVYRPSKPNGIAIVAIQGTGWYSPMRYDAAQLKSIREVTTHSERFAAEVHGFCDQPPPGSSVPLSGAHRGCAARRPVRPCSRTRVRHHRRPDRRVGAVVRRSSGRTAGNNGRTRGLNGLGSSESPECKGTGGGRIVCAVRSTGSHGRSRSLV